MGEMTSNHVQLCFAGFKSKVYRSMLSHVLGVGCWVSIQNCVICFGAPSSPQPAASRTSKCSSRTWGWHPGPVLLETPQPCLLRCEGIVSSYSAHLVSPSPQGSGPAFGHAHPKVEGRHLRAEAGLLMGRGRPSCE